MAQRHHLWQDYWLPPSFGNLHDAFWYHKLVLRKEEAFSDPNLECWLDTDLGDMRHWDKAKTNFLIHRSRAETSITAMFKGTNSVIAPCLVGQSSPFQEFRFSSFSSSRMMASFLHKCVCIYKHVIIQTLQNPPTTSCPKGLSS